MSNTANGTYTVQSVAFGGVNTVITLTGSIISNVTLNGSVTKGIVATYAIPYAGTSVPQANGVLTAADDITLPIASVNVAGKTFSILGNYTGLFVAPYNEFVIVVKSGVPNVLTFSSVVYTAPNTVVTVTDDIAGYGSATTLAPAYTNGGVNSEDVQGWGTGMTINVTAVTP